MSKFTISFGPNTTATTEVIASEVSAILKDTLLAGGHFLNIKIEIEIPGENK